MNLIDCNTPFFKKRVPAFVYLPIGEKQEFLGRIKFDCLGNVIVASFIGVTNNHLMIELEVEVLRVFCVQTSSHREEFVSAAAKVNDLLRPVLMIIDKVLYTFRLKAVSYKRLLNTSNEMKHIAVL